LSDSRVAALLRSDSPLVLIEAPAGCGKTYQGATYASEASTTIGNGRVLILTHTHAACGVFVTRTSGNRSRVCVRTIDGLIGEIAAVYHKALDLPPDPPLWAWRDNGLGFPIMAKRVAALLERSPMIAEALSKRFPIVVCDEHQDSSTDQHIVAMALHRAGSRLRIFADPMQRIYGEKTEKAAGAERQRWEALKKTADFDRLSTPHRWKDGSPELGDWIMQARIDLERGAAIDLTRPLPPTVRLIFGTNRSRSHRQYRLTGQERRELDVVVRASKQLLVLGPKNDIVDSLCGFWNRSIPLWEGHTRSALAVLVSTIQEVNGDALALATAMIEFIGSVSIGFSWKSHGERLLQEISEGCSKKSRGKPAAIQEVGRHFLGMPSHKSIGSALEEIDRFVTERNPGFTEVKIDRRVEFRDAIRVCRFESVDDGFAQVSGMRSHGTSSPPSRALSTIHKAKGLECDDVVVVACDRDHLRGTSYARCVLYVALSRAKKSLTLVVSTVEPSPLFQL